MRGMKKGKMVSKESKLPKTIKESKMPKGKKDTKLPKNKALAPKKGKKSDKMTLAPKYESYTLNTCSAPNYEQQGTCSDGYLCDSEYCGSLDGSEPARPTDPCYCFPQCTTDIDCTSRFGPDYGCFVGTGGSSVKYCTPKCTTDSDCPAPLLCGYYSAGSCF